MNKCDLKLDWCSAKAARFACEHWHYSKTMPVNKLVKIGVWEYEKYIGVVIFGVGASANIHRQFDLTRFEVCELVRVALSKHENQVSRIIAIAIRMLKKANPGIKVIVSFADPSHSHHGGIYQAGGWYYTGDSISTREYFYNGAWRHVTDVGKRVKLEHRKSLPIRFKQGKHRYVMPIDQKIKKYVESIKKQYPKRAGSADSGTSGNQPGGGGATPTPALLHETGVVNG